MCHIHEAGFRGRANIIKLYNAVIPAGLQVKAFMEAIIIAHAVPAMQRVMYPAMQGQDILTRIINTEMHGGIAAPVMGKIKKGYT